MNKSKFPQLNDPNWLHQKYINEQLDATDIANLVGCFNVSVLRALRKHGIPTRTRAECVTRKLQRPETRAKISAARRGKNNPFFGKHHTDETRKIMSEAKKGDKNPNRQNYTDEHRRRISESRLGKKHWFHGKHLNEEHRRKTSETLKSLWNDPNFVERMMESRYQYPNMLESRVEDALNRVQPNEWKYNGNFEQGVMIGGLIPDFVNVSGKKAVIEVFGEYWHGARAPRKSWKRSEFGNKATYSQLGFVGIVLWEQDIETAPDLDEFIRDRLLEAEH